MWHSPLFTSGSHGPDSSVRPLFQALEDNPRTRDLARRIYARARPTYHPITAASIDAILKPK